MENFFFRDFSSSSGPAPNHHVIYPPHAGPQQVPPPTPSSTNMGVNPSTSVKGGSGGKKSSPQFRWRRRKRRSKAQYPEMSRYLLPIDDGEEVRTVWGKKLRFTHWNFFFFFSKKKFLFLFSYRFNI